MKMNKDQKGTVHSPIVHVGSRATQYGLAGIIAYYYWQWGLQYA